MSDWKVCLSLNYIILAVTISIIKFARLKKNHREDNIIIGTSMYIVYSFREIYKTEGEKKYFSGISTFLRTWMKTLNSVCPLERIHLMEKKFLLETEKGNVPEM